MYITSNSDRLKGIKTVDYGSETCQGCKNLCSYVYERKMNKDNSSETIEYTYSMLCPSGAFSSDKTFTNNNDNIVIKRECRFTAAGISSLKNCCCSACLIKSVCKNVCPDLKNIIRRLEKLDGVLYRTTE
jgi:hypothetical protein